MACAIVINDPRLTRNKAKLGKPTLVPIRQILRPYSQRFCDVAFTIKI